LPPRRSPSHGFVGQQSQGAACCRTRHLGITGAQRIRCTRYPHGRKTCYPSRLPTPPVRSRQYPGRYTGPPEDVPERSHGATVFGCAGIIVSNMCSTPYPQGTTRNRAQSTAPRPAIRAASRNPARGHDTAALRNRTATPNVTSMLAPGTPLPEFTAVDDHGDVVSSASWRGRWTVLWWYVKADTPG
jgi:hypothetical protein